LNTMEGLDLDRHLLRMIFCSHCVSLDKTWRDSKASDYEYKEYRQALTYVLRETVRFEGDKDLSFYSRPVVFAKKLLLAIKFHAENLVKVKLPSVLTQQLLEALHTTNRTDQRLALEHIQHVTDIYIAGFVLGEIKIVFNGSMGSCTLFDYMSLPGEPFKPESVNKVSCENFRKSFALAALFHDMAMFDHKGLTVEKAKQTLLQHSILEELDHDKLAASLNKQNEHSLFSAAMLIEQIEAQNRLYANDATPKAMAVDHFSKPATLAVLYHSMPQIACGAGKLGSPVTQWLSMLDELLEWHPSTDLEPDINRAVDLSPHFNLGTPPKNTQPIKERVVLEDVKWSVASANDPDELSCLIIEVSKKKPVKFPYFHVYLSSSPALRHRKTMAILTLAQTFGRFRSSNWNMDFEWKPAVEVHYEQTTQSVITKVHQQAKALSNEVTSLLHQLCDVLEPENNSLIIRNNPNPFANIDIRKYVKRLTEIDD
jgi:hypothetical protein